MKKICILFLLLSSPDLSQRLHAGNKVIFPVGGHSNRNQGEPRQEGMSCPHIPLTRPWYAVLQSFSIGGLLMGIIAAIIFAFCLQPENSPTIRIIGFLLLLSNLGFVLWIDYNEDELFESYKKRCPKEAVAWGIYKTEMNKKNPTVQNIMYELESAGYDYDSLKEINGSEYNVMFCGCK
jgi:hypothetical protein